MAYVSPHALFSQARSHIWLGYLVEGRACIPVGHEPKTLNFTAQSMKGKNTNGTKELNSTSLILCSCLLRFSFSNHQYRNGTDIKVQLKSGHGSQRTYIGIVTPPYHIFLNFALHVIQSKLIFNSPWMTHDADDLGDPTWFQRWCVCMLVLESTMHARVHVHLFSNYCQIQASQQSCTV